MTGTHGTTPSIANTTAGLAGLMSARTKKASTATESTAPIIGRCDNTMGNSTRIIPARVTITTGGETIRALADSLNP
jgi:hypothetical protein